MQRPDKTIEQEGLNWSRTAAEKRFNVFNILLMLLLMVITVLPFWHVLAGSLSDPMSLYQWKGLVVWPLGEPSLAMYEKVLSNPEILSGYYNTLIYVMVGTSISVLLTVTTGYVVSCKAMLVKPIMAFIIVTMFFSGGMIPTYLIMRGLGLVGSRWSILLSSVLSCYNIIVMRTAYRSIPISLTESAKLDGANDFKILWRIYAPLSLPTIAVITLFCAVGRWNDWFTASIYLRNRTMYPLQLLLREILIQSQSSSETAAGGGSITTHIANVWSKKALQYTTIIVATVPILLVYPFIQKYFVKGVMLGAIKE